MAGQTAPDGAPVPHWVLRAHLRRPALAAGSGTWTITGLLVLADEVPASLVPRVRMDGVPVEVHWDRRSPKMARRFPEVDRAGRAAFATAELSGSGLVELLVENPETGLREVVASRQVRAAPADAAKTIEAVRTRLAELRLGDDRDHADYRKLRKCLKQVPKRDRRQSWQRARLEVDGVFLEKPRRAFKTLRELRDAHIADDSMAEFETWFAEYSRLIYPRTIGYFGYWTSLASRDEPSVWASIAKVTGAVEELGYDAFVISGTLLGLIRDGGLISHDSDVDLAVMLHSASVPDVVAEWTELRERLDTAGVLYSAYQKEGKRLYKLSLPNGFISDLFPAWQHEGRVYIWPHTFDEQEASVLPLATREVSGATVKVPQAPEQVLAFNYGPDWRTPDPLFKFDWRAAQERFASFIAHT